MAKKTARASRQNNSQELLEALTVLEKEKNISKESIIQAIEDSLQTACKQQFDRNDNIRVVMNPDTCEYHVYADKMVVEDVEDPVIEISEEDANRDSQVHYAIGEIYPQEIYSKEFGRIATQNAKNVILQKIREEERKVIYDEYSAKERQIVTGIVQRNMGRNVSINLGKADAILTRSEMIRGETFEPTERVRVLIVEVKETSKGPKIILSRTHPDFVRRLFEEEVAEVRDGIVEIRAIAREAGSRTKMAVSSNDPNVDPVGACVGVNGMRVNAVVAELNGEKIDIINWDDNAALLIQNALSPAKVISVIADADEKTAKVVVPDYQLSLAIGKEGQNARLAARLTGYKIDIKSETQARESGDLLDYDDYEDYDEDDLDYEDGLDYEDDLDYGNFDEEETDRDFDDLDRDAADNLDFGDGPDLSETPSAFAEEETAEGSDEENDESLTEPADGFAEGLDFTDEDFPEPETEEISGEDSSEADGIPDDTVSPEEELAEEENLSEEEPEYSEDTDSAEIMTDAEDVTEDEEQ